MMSTSKPAEPAESSRSGKKRNTRKVTLAACDTCRVKKSACDGMRPQCTRCRLRNRESPCNYPTEDPKESRGAALKRQNENLRQRVQELEELLQGNGAPTSSATPSASDLTPSDTPSSHQRPSVNAATMFSAVVPQVNTTLEHELISSHPNVYHSLRSTDFGTIRSNFARVAPLFAPLDHRPKDEPQFKQRAPDGLPTTETHPRAILRAFDPVRPPNYCDWRLERLQISQWTSVDVSNDLAARLLSWFLQTDHPIIGAFDADLFLDDLISLRPVFCSSLLVNAVLCWACHAYTAFDEQAGLFRIGFYTTAWDCWMRDSTEASHVSASAGLILNLILSSNGKDALSKAVLRQSCEMAEKLDMFGTPPDVTTRLDQQSIDNRKAWSHCAWGLFNHVTQRSFTYQDRVMRYAPKYGIPGNGGIIGHDLAGNQVYHKLPQYVSLTFTHLCRLWLIGNQVALNFWNDPRLPLPDRISMHWAESVYQNLLKWSDDTTMHDADGRPTPHHCNLFHIHFHSLVLDLFRPFIHSSNTARGSLSPSTTQVHAIFAASVRQLRYQILLDPISHEQARTSILWHTALLQVGNAALSDLSSTQNLSNPESWFFFFLCLSRYQDLADHYPIMTNVVRGFLAMAIDRGALGVGDAKELQWKLQGDGLGTEIGAFMKGSWVLDLDRALLDMQGAQVEVLADGFESLKEGDEGKH